MATSEQKVQISSVQGTLAGQTRTLNNPQPTSAPDPDKEHSTDTNKLADEQIEKNIVRKLLGHPLSTDIEGFTPETRKILTNTKPVLRQIKRNEKKVIMSYDGADNYDLDILLIDMKYGVDEFTNVIDIEFRELAELKAPSADELADKKRIADLEGKLDLEKSVNNMLQDQLNNTKDELDNTQSTLDDLLNTQTSTGQGKDPGSPLVQQFNQFLNRANAFKNRPGANQTGTNTPIHLATEVKTALMDPDILGAAAHEAIAATQGRGNAPVAGQGKGGNPPGLSDAQAKFTATLKTALAIYIQPVNVLLQRPGVDNFIDTLIGIITDSTKTIQTEEVHEAVKGRG